VGPVSTDGLTKFSCNPQQKPAMDQLRALTNRQYLNTLTDLLTSSLGAAAAADVLQNPTVTAALALLPPSTPTIPLPLPDPTPQIPGTAEAITNAIDLAGNFPDGGWLRADQSIQQARVAALYSIGVALGQVLATNYLGQLVGSCALGSSGAMNTSCLDTFIQSFGARTLRRALSAQTDVPWYEGFYDLNGPDSTLTNPSASGYQDVLTGFFNAPEFLYFVEHGDPSAPSSANGVYPLSAYELASRLSYQVWDTMPDETLWGHAVDGSLLEANVYAEEVDRLFADPRARATLDLFFTDYFQAEARGGPRGTGGLNYHNLGALAVNPSAEAKTFAGTDLPIVGPNLFPDMLADALGLADYYSWTVPGTMHDLLASALSFAETKDVAQLYGLRVWDGKSTPPSFPPNERPGVFTRALFVSAGLDTSPILKGVYFRRYVLCDELGAPPAAAAGKFVSISGLETTRQATTHLTSVEPCVGCHASFINPLGFTTESFDGLGRFRTKETIFSATGTVAGTLPVDTAVTPWVWMADSTTQASDAADLMNLAEQSNKPAACITRSYFRYSFARFEDVTTDGCSLEQMRETLDNGGQLADLWKSVVSTPAFKNRTFE
jgi:hypothetical protein